jgi:hypothetical protein
MRLPSGTIFKPIPLLVTAAAIILVSFLATLALLETSPVASGPPRR